MWRVASASQYLVITGWRIKDVKLAKKSWILPGQRCSTFNVKPVTYTFNVQAMSDEKLLFVLPAVFTIGPKCDDMEALRKYAKLVAPMGKVSNGLNDLVRGIIEGETRALAAGLTIEAIFKGTKQFKNDVFEKVQLELNEFGLHIYNANVKQLVEVKGHEYISYLGQKTQQEAANQAKVKVAEAKYKSDTQMKNLEGLTKQNEAKLEADMRNYAKQQEAVTLQQAVKLEAETKVYQSSKMEEIAEAESALATKSALWSQQAKMAKMEAEKGIAIREAELQKEVGRRKVEAETENLRASTLPKAVVDQETAVHEGNKMLHERRCAADAEAYELQRATDTALYACMKKADAELYAAKQEAAAFVVKADAQAASVRVMTDAFGGNYTAFCNYLLTSRSNKPDSIAADGSTPINDQFPPIPIPDPLKGGQKEAQKSWIAWIGTKMIDTP